MVLHYTVKLLDKIVFIWSTPSWLMSVKQFKVMPPHALSYVNLFCTSS
uniref:Uncharacterized protein n=1 Tax=Rhizophora mucronata TaxID=61149 RepID=A0A2P2NGD0_RHIMU